MTSYKSYQTTDEKWLPAIPKSWRAIKMKYLFDERSEKGHPEEQLLVASQTMGVVPKDVYGKRTVVATKDLHLLKLVREGDFVISLRSFQGGIEKAHCQGIISPAYTILRIKDLLVGDYFRYLGKSAVFIQLLKSCVTGIREGQNIDYKTLRDCKLPVPPRSEQDKIANFLDWKTSKINRLLVKLRKSILLLKEARGVVLYDFITKGISESERKESGDSILGPIPISWEIWKLKYLAKIYNGNSIKDDEKNKYTVKTDVPYISTKDVDLLSHSANYENGLYVKPDSLFKIAPSGCTLVCIEGGSAGRKKAYVTKDVAFVNKLCAFVPTKINGRFLFHYLCSPAFTEQFYKSITGLIVGVSMNTIKQLLIPVPPESEQEMIAKQIDERCERIDKQIHNLSKKIEFLNEYKGRITSDVVTGQVDVRDVEIPEYERVEDSGEPELEDIDELEEAGEPEEAKSEV